MQTTTENIKNSMTKSSGKDTESNKKDEKTNKPDVV